MSENRECSLFLGVHVAERVLKNVFKNVEVMPYGNHGFDFICNHKKMIDAKAACSRCRTKNSVSWGFHVRRNKIADYFLCIAFDNREDLNPLYIWLLPAEKFNHLYDASISMGTIHKWDEYRLDIDKTVDCCNAMKEV